MKPQTNNRDREMDSVENKDKGNAKKMERPGQDRKLRNVHDKGLEEKRNTPPEANREGFTSEDSNEESDNYNTIREEKDGRQGLERE